MSSENRPFPIYQLQDAFEAFCNGEPLAKPQHRSLYYFLLGYCRRRGNAPRFNLAYEAGMHGSGIGSWATYDAALKSLAEWGFIYYTPGANRYKVPVVELTFRNPTDDVLLTYWQSYCLSTANPTGDVLATQLVTLKEVLKKESEKVEKLESEKALYQADVAAANAALVEAQKKIAELEAQPLPESPNAQAPQAEGGAADVATSVPLRATKGGKLLLTGELADLLNPGGTAERVQKMKSPFTQTEADALVAKYGAPAARAILVEMSNYAKLTNNVSANLTAQKWLDKRHSTPGQPLPNPQRNAYGNHTSATSAAARLHTPAPDASAGWGYPGG